MVRAFSILMMSALVALSPAAPAAAMEAHEHKIFQPAEMGYAPGPVSLPPGAEHSVLYGDPAAEGQFVMRLKMPDRYYIPPHTHPMLESVTVLSGAVLLGMDESGDRDTAQRIETGGYFGMPAGMTHYAFTEGETVVQLNGIGPWQINYTNPEDDPRRMN